MYWIAAICEATDASAASDGFITEATIARCNHINYTLDYLYVFFAFCKSHVLSFFYNGQKKKERRRRTNSPSLSKKKLCFSV